MLLILSVSVYFLYVSPGPLLSKDLSLPPFPLLVLFGLCKQLKDDLILWSSKCDGLSWKGFEQRKVCGGFYL